MSKIEVELVTPESLCFSGTAILADIPGLEGDFGVLEDHAPLISSLRAGMVNIIQEEKHSRFFVAEGFAEVTGKRCTILAEYAIDLASVNLAKANEMLEDTKNKHSASTDESLKVTLEKQIAAQEELVRILS